MKIRARADDLELKDLGTQHWIGVEADGWVFALVDISENLDTYQYLP